MSDTKTTWGEPCPEWCVTHNGERAISNEYISPEAGAEDCVPLGKHRHSFYLYRRFEHFPPVAVEVHQEIARGGLWGPQVMFWHGTTGVETEPGGFPIDYRVLSAGEARDLGNALIAAADLVGEILPDRCTTCGEPVEPDHEACTRCGITARREAAGERRKRLSIVE